MSKETKKFYKPGTLAEKGTKISLKTQPYINGIVFDVKDPITSFHSYMAKMNNIIHQYEYLVQIPGMKEIVSEHYGDGLTMEDIAKVKLLISYLAQSPIEMTLKEQVVDNDVLADLAITQQAIERH